MSKTGNPGAFEQPSSYWRNETGAGATVPYESVTKDDINAIAVDCDRRGLNYRVVHGYGKSRIEVDYSYNPQAQEQSTDIWEYMGREVPKNLLQADTNTGITATLSQKNLELISRCLNNDFSTTADKTSLVQSDFTDGNQANAMIVYNLMRAGFVDYPIVAPILRHTQTVSQIYPITLSQLNVRKIISTSTLLSLETVPYWAIPGLPTIVPPNFTAGITVVYAWLKHSPNIQQAAFRKTSIVQEFEYGLWPTSTFGSAL
jgi:hypothetical protein